MFCFYPALGPVTAVDFHTASSTGVDLSHLYLSASFDWTFKLWSMREQKPLYSFEDGSDYLYDVRWSPIHPALFATVDGLGRLDIWNLNHDTELPTVSTVVEGMSALNRLIWSPNGQQLVVGDDGGRIAVYDVGEVSAMTGLHLMSFTTNVFILLTITSNWRFQRTTSGRVSRIHFRSSPTTALTYKCWPAIHYHHR